MLRSIDAALDAFMASVRSFHQTYQRLSDWKLTRTRAHSLIVEMARGGVFSSSDILPVVQEFENPRHPEFNKRNAWTLYQASTEVMKSQSPSRQVDGLKALNRVLVDSLN